jgi:hypothetical protein
MENNYKIELKNVIDSSNITEDKKSVWNDFLQSITEEQALPILEALKENPEDINFLTDNLQLKIKAVKGKDKNAWQDIVSKEKNYLQE